VIARKISATGATEHLQKVAAFIATFKADMVNLVEVEGCSTLKSLIVDGGAAMEGTYTAYLEQGTDSVTGQDVALLTKCATVCSSQRHSSRCLAQVGGFMSHNASAAMHGRQDPASTFLFYELGMLLEWHGNH
jgi:hypothetical protein